MYELWNKSLFWFLMMFLTSSFDEILLTIHNSSLILSLHSYLRMDMDSSVSIYLIALIIYFLLNFETLTHTHAGISIEREEIRV